VAWSPASVASRYVRWEAQRAEQQRKLMPVLIEPTDLPPEYFLVQAADLTRWEGDTTIGSGGGWWWRWFAWWGNRCGRRRRWRRLPSAEQVVEEAAPVPVEVEEVPSLLEAEEEAPLVSEPLGRSPLSRQWLLGCLPGDCSRSQRSKWVLPSPRGWERSRPGSRGGCGEPLRARSLGRGGCWPGIGGTGAGGGGGAAAGRGWWSRSWWCCRGWG